MISVKIEMRQQARRLSKCWRALPRQPFFPAASLTLATSVRPEVSIRNRCTSLERCGVQRFCRRESCDWIDPHVGRFRVRICFTATRNRKASGMRGRACRFVGPSRDLERTLGGRPFPRPYFQPDIEANVPAGTLCRLFPAKCAQIWENSRQQPSAESKLRWHLWFPAE